MPVPQRFADEWSVATNASSMRYCRLPKISRVFLKNHLLAHKLNQDNFIDKMLKIA
jgi:hypothetical protein